MFDVTSLSAAPALEPKEVAKEWKGGIESWKLFDGFKREELHFILKSKRKIKF